MEDIWIEGGLALGAEAFSAKEFAGFAIREETDKLMAGIFGGRFLTGVEEAGRIGKDEQDDIMDKVLDIGSGDRMNFVFECHCAHSGVDVG